jgi:hypothetical protein
MLRFVISIVIGLHTAANAGGSAGANSNLSASELSHVRSMWSVSAGETNPPSEMKQSLTEGLLMVGDSVTRAM